jgi:putative nucleotidyltransferase with HDIG domain
MYVHAIEASWLQHPFWRRRFLITEQDELQTLREAGVAFVTIDTARGAAPDPVEPAPGETRDPEPEADAIDGATVTITTERQRAADIITRSKSVMRDVFDGARLGKAFESEAVIAVVDEISASVQRNAQALIGLVRLKSKAEYTYLHSVAVCALMVNMARQLSVPEETMRDMGLAGLVHDIGKMSVPEEILNKPGRLTDAEFDLVRTHPSRGLELLRQASGIPDIAMDVCSHHHEKIDGTGYPFGLKGEDISLAARLGAICDVYDALTSDRSYKEGWTPGDAVTAMASWDGHFDPGLLFAFFQSISVFPVGMLVRMRSNHLAIVLPNGRRASRPRVRLVYDIGGDHLIAPRDTVVTDGEAGDQILTREDPATWRIRDWLGVSDHLQREAANLDRVEIERLWTGAGDGAVELEPGRERVSTWRPSQHLN